MQVVSYRCTGRRVFLCAPLHHHYQLRGWSEAKIVPRFWLAAILCAACGLAGWAAGLAGGSIGITAARKSTPTSDNPWPDRVARAERGAGPLDAED
jgi:hypothetical protein